MRSASAVCLGLAATAVDALIARNGLEGCLIAAQVPIDQRGTIEYKNDTTPFNLRLPYTPEAVAVPKSTEHIQKAVWCGKKSGVKVSAKSGGHSYASFGFGGENGHLMIELNRMDGVSAKGDIAVVQPGARLGHLATVLNNKYGRAIAHGTCPGVGISGHFLHGGFGFSSHMHGLALDFIDSAVVVLADGRVVEATANGPYSDLLWGLKGAGSNFGIVAEWRLRTIAAPKVLTRFIIPLGWTNKSQAIQGISAVEAYAKTTAPREINFRIGDYGRGKAQIEGLFYGDKTQWEAAIAPLLAAIPQTYTIQEARSLPWLESVVSYSNFDDIDMFYPVKQPEENFYSKSLTVKTLAGKAVEGFVNYYFDTAINDDTINHDDRFWFFQLDVHGGANSQVAKVSNSATAYAHRDKLFLMQFYDRYPNDFKYPAGDESFLTKWVAATTAGLKTSDWGAYINYADPKLDRDTAQRLYYGENLSKLQRLKGKYDPSELFYYPQAIRPGY